MGSTLFRDPQALSSTLAAFRTLQPWAFRSLNRVDPLDSVSNYYIDVKMVKFLKRQNTSNRSSNSLCYIAQHG